MSLSLGIKLPNCCTSKYMSTNSMRDAVQEIAIMKSLKWPTIVSWFSLGVAVAFFVRLEIVGLGYSANACLIGLTAGIVVSWLVLILGLAFIHPPSINPWRRRAIITLLATLLPGGFLLFATFTLTGFWIL